MQAMDATESDAAQQKQQQQQQQQGVQLCIASFNVSAALVLVRYNVRHYCLCRSCLYLQNDSVSTAAASQK